MLRACFRSFGLALCAILLCACKTHTITNLTPTHQPRNDAGVYHFEVAWGSQQQSIRTNSIKPFVVIDQEFYPMEKTPLVKGRWEAFVPVPATQKEVHYRYKFNYDYKAIPAVRGDSKLSSPHSIPFPSRCAVRSLRSRASLPRVRAIIPRTCCESRSLRFFNHSVGWPFR